MSSLIYEQEKAHMAVAFSDLAHSGYRADYPPAAIFTLLPELGFCVWYFLSYILPMRFRPSSVYQGRASEGRYVTLSIQ